jgi:predicted PurR-regulated permease PerM
MNRALASGPVVWIGIIATTCLALVIFQTVLWLVLPILFAVFFYYVLVPWVNLGVSRGLTRGQAVFMVTVLLWIFVVGAGLIVGPKVSMAVSGMRNGQVEDYLRDGADLVNKARTTLYDRFSLFPPPKNPTGAIDGQPLGVVTVADSVPAPKSAPAEALKNNVAVWTNKYSGSVLLELLHWIPSLLLVPYLTYFFLLDGPRFKRFLVQAIPNAFFEKTLFLFYRVEDQLRSYFRGLLLLTALDGFCLAVGLWFLGLNAPFFLAGVAAVMAWLPYLGSIAGCLMVVLVAHHDHPASVWLPYETIGLFILVRLCDDFVFLPMTVGRSLRMHPLITVLMILLGGAVAGISGLLLVMPVLGVVMVIGQIGGELFTDARILARFRHARDLRRNRARADLYSSAEAIE